MSFNINSNNLSQSPLFLRPPIIVLLPHTGDLQQLPSYGLLQPSPQRHSNSRTPRFASATFHAYSRQYRLPLPRHHVPSSLAGDPNQIIALPGHFHGGPDQHIAEAPHFPPPSSAAIHPLPNGTVTQSVQSAVYIHNLPRLALGTAPSQSRNLQNSVTQAGGIGASHAREAQGTSLEEPVMLHNREYSQQATAPLMQTAPLPPAEDLLEIVVDVGQVPEQQVQIDCADSPFQAAEQGIGNQLNFRDFLDALDSLDAYVPHHYALHIFAESDVDGDGWINRDEFVVAHARVILWGIGSRQQI